MKCVMIIDKELPAGFIANTAAALGLSLGGHVDGLNGPEVADKAQNRHLGITRIPIPILAAGREQIKAIYERVRSESIPDMTVIGFSSVAQKCNKYEEYMERMGYTEPEHLDYLGICLYGPQKLVTKLSGSIPMLR